jgi:hypothetical protein
MYTINLENVRFSSDIKFRYKPSKVFAHPMPDDDDVKEASEVVNIPVKCELFFYNKKAELINYDRYNSINVVV